MPPLDAAPEKPLRVLIVDDDDVFAGSLATILSADPRLEVVDRAANGAQGLMLAVDEQPDVLEEALVAGELGETHAVVTAG